MFEIKIWIDKTAVFGEKVKKKKTGNSDSRKRLAETFKGRKDFVSRPDGRYCLRTFETNAACGDELLSKRLVEVADKYVIVLRHKPMASRSMTSPAQ